MESQLGRHRRPERFGFYPQGQILSSCGWMVIGIPSEGITSGMKAIGLDHRTRELAGLCRTTTVNGSLWVTGKEITVVWTTITTGTATATGTSATGTVTGTTTDTVITTATIDSARRRNRSVALAARVLRFQAAG